MVHITGDPSSRFLDRSGTTWPHALLFQRAVPAFELAVRLRIVRTRADIRTAIEKRFGSLDKWTADFIASAKAAAGWAMLVHHPVNGRLYNIVSDEHAMGPLWLAMPIVVIDVYEHAFYIDYQNKKAEYVEKFIDFIDWAEANRRFRAATKT